MPQWSPENPPWRTRHLIGNLEARPLANGEVQAKTAFLVYRSHLETDHQLLSGCREAVLRQVKGGMEGGPAHDCARRQRSARREAQRLPLVVPFQPNPHRPAAGAAGASVKGLRGRQGCRSRWERCALIKVNQRVPATAVLTRPEALDARASSAIATRCSGGLRRPQ